MKKTHFACILLLIGISACKEKDPSPKASINPIFLPYFNTFLEEGKKRDMNFTTQHQAITIQLSGLLRKTTGYDGLTTNETRTIDIDSSWLQYPEPDKERLIFHELGHLMLGRDHTLTQLPNGEYSSLMRTLENNPDRCTNTIYTGKLRRAYYLDELFKSSTPAPAWSNDNVAWKEPSQTTQTTVVGASAWNKNTTLDALVSNSPNQVSYKILPTGMNLVVGKTQTVNSEFKLPLNTLFPNLAETPLQNYEVRMRYKLYGRGFELGWAPNNAENSHSLISNNCGGENNYFGVSNNRGGFFVNKTILQNLSGTNDLVLQQKDNYIMIWLNGRLIFQSDITAGTAPSPLGMSLYFGASQYDFEFITVTRL